MREVIRILHLADPVGADAAVERVRSSLADLSGFRSVVAPTLPGARNGGDVIVRLRMAGPGDDHRGHAWLETALDGPDVDRIVGATLGVPDTRVHMAGRRDGADGPGVYRILLAKVADDTPAEKVDEFERALLQMPEHIPHIRAWRLTRVDESTGSTTWTHAWEQEYDDVDGLLGPYMNHPIHWAHVDQWFDPESPRRIVRDRVVHSFCAIDAPALDTTG